jgi:hypothetical protein
MYYIGVPGQATHRAGHVIDLTFSNVSFAKSAVDASMHSRLDHKTIVTSIPALVIGTLHLDQYHYRVLETSLPKFTGLVKIGVQMIQDPCHEDVTSRPLGTASVVLINYYVQYLGGSRRCVPNRTLLTTIYILVWIRSATG